MGELFLLPRETVGLVPKPCAVWLYEEIEPAPIGELVLSIRRLRGAARCVRQRHVATILLASEANRAQLGANIKANKIVTCSDRT